MDRYGSFCGTISLNARSFFAPSTIPQLIQNQFGAAAGGPIKKNKLFVFGSYEGLRVRPASLGASSFPLTEAERRGDFSSSTTPIRDPDNANQPFPGNQIPVSRFDTVARNLLNPSQMPLPNAPGGQLITTFPTPADNDQYLFRVDWNLGRHVIDGRYNLNKAYDRGSAGNVPEYLPLDRSADVNSITIGDTWSVRPDAAEPGADFVQPFFIDLHKSEPDPSERPGRELSAVRSEDPSEHRDYGPCDVGRCLLSGRDRGERGLASERERDLDEAAALDPGRL